VPDFFPLLRIFLRRRIDRVPIGRGTLRRARGTGVAAGSFGSSE
jgi:hypothetical protein